MKTSQNRTTHKKIGQWLKCKREAAGLSRKQLANLTGHHESFIGRYEAGQRLDFIQFTKIALALKTEPCEVMESCMANVRK